MKTRASFTFQVNQPKAAISLPLSLSYFIIAIYGNTGKEHQSHLCYEGEGEKAMELNPIKHFKN